MGDQRHGAKYASASLNPKDQNLEKREAGFASGGHATPGNAFFPSGSADTSPSAPAPM